MSAKQNVYQFRYTKDTATLQLPGIESTLLSKLNQMRKDGVFCDVTLRNKSDPQSRPKVITSYPVHACVLAANSQSLYDVLSSDSSIREIHLQLFVDSVFEMFIRLIYGETVDIPCVCINDLKLIAQGLGVVSICEMCDYVSKQIEEMDKIITMNTTKDSHLRISMHEPPFNINPIPMIKQKKESESVKRRGKKIVVSKNESAVKNVHYNTRPAKKVKVAFDDIYGLPETSGDDVEQTTESEMSMIDEATSGIAVEFEADCRKNAVITRDHVFCDHCNRTFSSSRALKKHKRRFVDEKGVLNCRMRISKQAATSAKQETSFKNTEIKCDHCDRTFESMTRLRMHQIMVKYETDPDVFTRKVKRYKKEYVYCDHCQHNFADPQSLQKHKERLAKNPNKFRLFNRKQTREERLAAKKKNYYKRRQCKQCGQIFVTLFALSTHTIVVHQQRHRCQYCQKCFATPSVLDVHIRRHTGEKPFLCSQCDFRAVSAHDVRLHEENHHSGNGPHMCTHCGKLCKSLSALKAHEYRNHGSRPKKDVTVACDICNNVYKGRSHYLRHMRQVHNVEPKLYNSIRIDATAGNLALQEQMQESEQNDQIQS